MSRSGRLIFYAESSKTGCLNISLSKGNASVWLARTHLYHRIPVTDVIVTFDKIIYISCLMSRTNLTIDLTRSQRLMIHVGITGEMTRALSRRDNNEWRNALKSRRPENLFPQDRDILTRDWHIVEGQSTRSFRTKFKDTVYANRARVKVTAGI